MSLPRRHLPILAISCLVLGSVLGGLLGGRVQAEGQKPDDEVWTLGQILAMVEDHYVGSIDNEEMTEHAIEGMLHTLDPHSNYLDPESFSEMRDEQRGRFHGLGIQITKRGADKPLTIIAPIDGTPAQRAGLQSGDIISKIEGQPTIDLTVQEAVRRLKGDKGTKVTITIQRPGLEEAFDVTLERDEIPIESIRVAYLIQPSVGLIRIGNFTTTTADELDKAIDKLRTQGMTRLVLDLRGNPGGLLEQAVQVAERFVPGGKLVVYTRGRVAGSNQDFVAKSGRPRLDLPLVVLVDRSSASASEIVSGAIQDHDRGLVVGETTFGKGLVQRVIPLQVGGGAALAITTAKYYTPSGRLIQRDYTDLDEYYLSRAEDQDPEAEAAEPEPDPALPAVPDVREVFYTASGRKVYGGGGITPDYVVPTPKAPTLLSRMVRENVLFDYAVSFAAAHPDLQKGFTLEAPVIDELRRFLVRREIRLTDEEFESNRQEIGLRLRAQIARIAWDQVEEARVLAEGDPQIQRALQLFDEASQLADRAEGGRPGRKPVDLHAGAASDRQPASL